MIVVMGTLHISDADLARDPYAILAKVEQGVEIDFPISRQDVAEMTGATLHTVSRILSAWEQQGLVEGGRQRIVLRDPHRLFALAEGHKP